MKKTTRKSLYTMLGIMMMGIFLLLLNNVAINMALPNIMTDLGVEKYATVQWLTSINMLLAGILIPTSAYFMIRFKSHHVFMTCIAIFAVGTILAIFAPNFRLLLIARFIQAAGGALIMPLVLNVILTSFSREHRGKAMGVYGLVIMIAPVIAPIFSGIMVDYLGWRGIFIVIAPLALLLLGLSFWKLENVLEQRSTSIDFLSVLLSSLAFTSILLGFGNASTYNWTHPFVLGVIFIGIISLSVFIRRQLKLPMPLLDMKVYGYSMFAISSIISVLLTLILFAPMILLPYYFQTILGYSTLHSGLVLMPGTLIMALAMPFAGKMYDKFSARPLAVIGFTMIGMAAYFLALLTIETSAIYVAIWFMIRSFGISLIMMPMQTNGLNQLPSYLNASGSAVNGTVQQVSGAIGTAVFVTLKTNYSDTRTQLLINEATVELGTPVSEVVVEELTKLAGVDAINFTSIVTLVLAVIALAISLFVKKEIHR